MYLYVERYDCVKLYDGNARTFPIYLVLRIHMNKIQYHKVVSIGIY